jgi:hypothetical protein
MQFCIDYSDTANPHFYFCQQIPNWLLNFDAFGFDFDAPRDDGVFRNELDLVRIKPRGSLIIKL